MKKPHSLSRLLFPGIYNEGKGEIVPLPAGGAKLFFFLLGTYFFKLIALNLLTLLLCLPVLTIPASLSALSRALMKLALYGYGSVYQEYFTEWKSALVRYIPFALLTAMPAVGGTLLVYSRIAEISGIGGFMLIAVCALLFLFCYLLWCYAFPLFATIDLPVGQNARNAAVFAATQRKANLALLLPLVFGALCLLFWPWTAPVFLLLFVSIGALWICCVVKPPIYENIIVPYQTEAEASASHHQQGEESTL